MRTPTTFAALLVLPLLPRSGFAEEVSLPAPVLEWSLYILLAFAISVAVGIFFLSKGRNGKNEALSELLKGGRETIHSVNPDTLVSECVRQMNEQKIGAMLVMEEERLAGIFTERDAMTRVLGSGRDPAVTRVSEVMTKEPCCVSPLTTMEEAMSIVSNRRVRHLPVVQDGTVLGMISSGDLTHRLVRDQAGEIQELVDLAGRR
jgi:CBS domain-containing protein